jgi:hypothetical protein
LTGAPLDENCSNLRGIASTPDGDSVVGKSEHFAASNMPLGQIRVIVKTAK